MTASIKTSSVAAALLCGALQTLAGQDGAKITGPLPLEVAVSQRGHNVRSPINISPDGEWVAHTVQAIDRVPRDSVSRRYSATGFSFAEGDARMEATISNTRTGEVIRLGGEKSASWAATWSPTGTRLAFYSDEGGAAGLWIWERATRRATRIPDIIVRPLFGFETVKWSADGERLIVPVLPSGMTIAQANGRDGGTRQAVRFAPVAEGEPSVTVRRVDATPARADTAARPARDAAAPARIVGDLRWAENDLALVDVRTQRVTRLVERTAVRGYALSPDGQQVAYTISKGAEENTQQSVYDLVVQQLAGGRRTLGTNVRLGYGIEWSWSPDSRTIAVISSGLAGSGRMVLYPAAGGAARILAADSTPSFDPGDGEHAPLWDGARHLYATGGGALWRIDAASGRSARVGHIPGWQIRTAVSADGATLWTTGGGRLAWVVARETGGARSGIYSIDLRTGEARPALQEAKRYSGIFSLTASSVTGQIAFVSSGQLQLPEIWTFDTGGGKASQASRINHGIDRYHLGVTRVIDWRTADGQALRGALLLPPAYRSGTRVPLVVWVYGGSMGSNSAGTFGLTGMSSTFNMQVLATRGYAVLFPDAPVRPGTPMADLLRTVMPGVDAAVEQGYADPDRLALMGQSYGSYSVLALITQTPRFKAAVISAAVLHPDLAADYLRATGYYEQGQGNMGGSLWAHRDRYIANSPLYLFDKIQTPLLIGQGERDGDLVPSEAIFSALQRLEKPVEYRVYQGEGHVITRLPNVLDFWRRRLEFLAAHLDVALDSAGAVIFDGVRARPARR